MSLRLRVFAGLALLLALTLAAAWSVSGGAVLGPLIGQLTDERVDTALYIAREVEAAADPDARAAELGEALQVQVRVIRPGSGGWGAWAEGFEEEGEHCDRPGHEHGGREHGEGHAGEAGWSRWGRGWRAGRMAREFRRHARVVEKDGREVWVGRGARAPIVVPMGAGAVQGAVLVRFPADLAQPPRHLLVGLLILGAAGVLLSLGVSRWVLRPVGVARDAMLRVAEGDLSHRVPEGDDAAGQMGAVFNRMADRVAGMVEGQRQLMAAVSHELRTPLARMRLQVELLREAGAPEGRLAGLERDIDAIDELVGELLESVRLHQGTLALRLEPLDLAELLAEGLGRVDLGTRAVRLDVADGIAFTGDRRRLARAIRNLLSNVARYTPDGTEVTVEGRREGDEVIIRVADRGPGVPEAALERLFEPFFRAEPSRSRHTGGVGVGLMIVRQVVEAHGGRVEARNREGGGLAITLRLPATPAAPAG